MLLLIDDLLPLEIRRVHIAGIFGSNVLFGRPDAIGILIGHHGIVLMNGSRGCSNEKAKSALDWRPRYATWRTGFIDGLG